MRQSVSIPFAAVAAEKITRAEGKRLKAFIDQRWTRADGGITALAEAAGIRRPTLYAWFRAADAPELASLRAVASALGVTRAELVAAMDGTPGDALSSATEAALVTLAGEVGAEVTATLAARLPQLLDATSRDAGASRTRASRGSVTPQSNGRRSRR